MNEAVIMTASVFIVIGIAVAVYANYIDKKAKPRH